MPHPPRRRKHKFDPKSAAIAAQSPTAEAFSVLGKRIEPEDHWDCAYELLCEDKDGRALLDAYENILSSHLSDDDEVSAVSEGSRRSRNQSDMSALVRKKLKVIDDAKWKFRMGSRTVEIQTQIDKSNSNDVAEVNV